jgi:hypothetical protein
MMEAVDDPMEYTDASTTSLGVVDSKNSTDGNKNI